MIMKRDYLTLEEIKAFTGDNDFYIRKWQKYTHNKWFKGWNWNPFFFPIEWMFFRRLYLEAITIYFGRILLMLLAIIINSELLYSLTDFVFRGLLSLVAIFGNGLYFRKGLRIVNKYTELSKDELLAQLKKDGGNSWIAVFVILAIEIVLFLL